MKTGMRTLFVVVGLVLMYIAFLVLIAKPMAHPMPLLPPITIAHNVPYFLYLRGWRSRLLGCHAGTVMIANALLMLSVCGMVFRMGWGLADSRYRLLVRRDRDAAV